jgi:hypothetical protein
LIRRTSGKSTRHGRSTSRRPRRTRRRVRPTWTGRAALARFAAGSASCRFFADRSTFADRSKTESHRRRLLSSSMTAPGVVNDRTRSRQPTRTREEPRPVRTPNLIRRTIGNSTRHGRSTRRRPRRTRWRVRPTWTGRAALARCAAGSASCRFFADRSTFADCSKTESHRRKLLSSSMTAPGVVNNRTSSRQRPHEESSTHKESRRAPPRPDLELDSANNREVDDATTSSNATGGLPDMDTAEKPRRGPGTLRDARDAFEESPSARRAFGRQSSSTTRTGSARSRGRARKPRPTRIGRGNSKGSEPFVPASPGPAVGWRSQEVAHGPQILSS